MNDFEKIEHLLLSKRFEELSPTEVREVTGYFENATDYNDIRDTLMQVKSTLAADKLLIKPTVELKEKLLQKFENTHTNQGSASLGKTRPFYKNIAFQWSATATVVIVISLSIFGYIQNLNTLDKKEMAVNYESNTTHKRIDKGQPTIDGEAPEETSVKDENTSKVMVTTTDDVGSNKGEGELDSRSTTLGGTNTVTETSKINDGDANVNVDETKNNTKNFYFSSNRNNKNDNTTLDIMTNTTLNPKEEKTEDANEILNAVIITNGDKQNDDLKVKEEEKNQPLNTTIQNQNNLNTKVNYSQSTFDRDSWKKNKNENSKVNLGLAQDNLLEAEVADSLKMKTDSLKLDSNYKTKNK